MVHCSENVRAAANAMTANRTQRNSCNETRSWARYEQQRAPAAVDQVLRGAGHPLDLATRARMEAGFGRDFSNVRIFHDDAAASSARAVLANAYTVGNKIVFNSGRYAPASERGQRLLAHELAHVVQQDGHGPVALQRDAADDAGR